MDTYALWRTREAVLEAGAVGGTVGLTLDDVGHGALGAYAVHHLLRHIIRVRDECPRHVTEVPALG